MIIILIIVSAIIASGIIISIRICLNLFYKNPKLECRECHQKFRKYNIYREIVEPNLGIFHLCNKCYNYIYSECPYCGQIITKPEKDEKEVGLFCWKCNNYFIN